jgi:hypothetical protein
MGPVMVVQPAALSKLTVTAPAAINTAEITRILFPVTAAITVLSPLEA